MNHYKTVNYCESFLRSRCKVKGTSSEEKYLQQKSWVNVLPAGTLSLKKTTSFIFRALSESGWFEQHLLNVSFAIQHVKSSALPANCSRLLHGDGFI